MNLNILWIDDDYKTQEDFISFAEQDGIDIYPFESHEEGMESLYNKPNFYHGVILDAKVKKAGEIFIKGFMDHSYLNRWAKVAHNAIYVEDEQEFKENLNDIPNGNSWFHIYAYRYPNSEITHKGPITILRNIK